MPDLTLHGFTPRRRSVAIALVFCLAAACSGAGEAGEDDPGGNVDGSAADTAARTLDSATTYDSALAAELGADEYGMARYVVAFLRSGPATDIDSATAAELQRAHLDNIKRMAEEKSLLVAGPFLDDGDLRGIYIFDVESVEEARALTETDPAIQRGWLEMELHPWYGPAAMRALYDINLRIQREDI